MSLFKKPVLDFLDSKGVTVNGDKPWDMTVHDERLYTHMALRGSLGLGEAYMNGWWDAQKLDEMFMCFLRGGPHGTNFAAVVQDIVNWLPHKLFNPQSVSGAKEVGEKHYDIGNDLYKKMLDPRMIYSCGYWSGNPPAQTLAHAQEAKLDLICRKLRLKAGQKVLDIGCGWGGFAKFAAEKYGVEVVGITISKEQAALAQKECAGLPVEIRLEDYRNTKGAFDAVVSVGMFEHVGPRNYRAYMEAAHRLLKDDGLFLLHTIGGNFSGFHHDPWIEKYIFPNGVLPKITDVAAATERLFIVEDWHNFGPDYDKTLMAWYENFTLAWPQLKEKYDERFKRMWDYYLLASAATFRSRENQLWQLVLSKHGVEGGYRSVR